jgi:transposase
VKRLELTNDEFRTLREMGVFHSDPHTRRRAQAIVRLSQGLTLQKVADEFDVHLNSVEQWRQCWNKAGLAGLYEGSRSGRPPKWNEVQRQALRELAEEQGGTAGALLRHFQKNQQQPAVSVDTIKRYLKKRDMSYKRYRYSLRKNETLLPSSVRRT